MSATVMDVLWMIHGDEPAKEFFRDRSRIEQDLKPEGTWLSLLYALRHNHARTAEAIHHRTKDDPVASALWSAYWAGVAARMEVREFHELVRAKERRTKRRSNG